MKRIALAILAIAFVIGSVAPAFAVEMQARGSWRAAGTFYDNADFDDDGGEETFRAQQRARVWFDFIANENLKAVLGLEIGDVTWGGNNAATVGNDGALGTDGVNIEVKHAYLDFNLPNTSVNIKAGLQPIYIPGNLGSLILDDDAAALMISAPINDMISITGGWIRAIDNADQTQGGLVAVQEGDEWDTFALLVPVTADGFSVTPYLLYSMIGENVYGGEDDTTMYHAGFSAKVDMLDPIVIMTDFAYGSVDWDYVGTDVDQSGFIFDLAVDYKMDFMTPELFMWYVSGDDDDSDLDVMPVISPDFTASTFGFDGSALGEGNLLNGDVTNLPSWAIGFKLKDMSFVEDLSHTFTILYAKGTSDENSLVWFDEKDSMIEVNFDSKYQIYDELAAYLELGYINFDMDDDTNEDSAYKAALGIRYDF